MTGCEYTPKPNRKYMSLHTRMQKLEIIVDNILEKLLQFDKEYILKDSDKKRDDIINRLCQKLENMDIRLKEIEKLNVPLLSSEHVENLIKKR
jgi:hypothetical protein